MSHACPSCEKSFDSQRGVRSHHAQVHGEKLRDFEDCAWCGEDTVNTENSDKSFCDRDCYAKWQSENEVGEAHPTWEGGKVTCECAYCGSVVERKPAEADGNNFCDRDCHAEFMAENNNGIDHPLAKGDMLKCEWCGGEFYRSPANVTDGDNFCSEQCKGQHMSVHLTGENHPRYTGGRANYGKGWNYRKKETIRSRDNRVCQECGMTTIQHKMAIGRKLTVHHIQKAKSFEDDEKKNHPSNLVTLCMSCHNMWEKMSPLRPQ